MKHWRKRPVLELDELRAAGFYELKAVGTYQPGKHERLRWHCQWTDPLGVQRKCVRWHKSVDQCFGPDCRSRMGKWVAWRLAGGVDGEGLEHLLTGSPRPRPRIGMVVLPPGVSREGWPAAWVSAQEPKALTSAGIKKAKAWP